MGAGFRAALLVLWADRIPHFFRFGPAERQPEKNVIRINRLFGPTFCEPWSWRFGDQWREGCCGPPGDCGCVLALPVRRGGAFRWGPWSL